MRGHLQRLAADGNFHGGRDGECHLLPLLGEAEAQDVAEGLPCGALGHEEQGMLTLQAVDGIAQGNRILLDIS